MDGIASARASARLEAASVVATGLAAGLAVSALVGWQFSLPVLTHGVPGEPAMNPLTGCALLLAAVSLAVRRQAGTNGRARAVAHACAVLVAAVGAWRSIELLLGAPWGVDRALYGARMAAWPVPAGMGPPSAFALLCMGGGLRALDTSAPRVRALAAPSFFVSLAIALVALVGLGYQAQAMQGVMPSNTAAALILLCAGAFLARPDRDLCSLLLRRSSGGIMARRLLPFAVALPCCLGWLRLEGQRMGLFRQEIGTAIQAFVVSSLLVALILRTARNIDRAEREMERLHVFLDSVIEHLPNMVFVKDARELKFVRFNRAGEELVGFPREQLLGKSDHDFFPPEQAEFFVAKDRAVLERRELLDIAEEEIRTSRGETRLLHTKKVPILDADGTPLYLLGISEDITERRSAERERAALHESLRRRTAELEAANRELEAFSYSASHDLRAPLRHIDGFTDLLVRHSGAKLDDTGRRHLDTISKAAKSMGRLIDDLLAFSRMSRADMLRAPVELEELVADARRSLDRDTAGRNVRWQVSPLPMVQGDRAMLRLVVTNLLANAVKYTRPRAEALIEVGASDEGGDVVLFVRDNGVGFDMRYLNKLFGVFQRLHRDEEFEGTGIGLASVRRIVERHGGRAWAEGQVDAGATFYIALPRTAEALERQEAA